MKKKIIKSLEAYNEGVAKYKLGRYEESIKDFDKAIKLDSKFKKAYNNRGVVKYKLGRYEESMKDYNKAIKLDSKYAEVYNNRGILKGTLKNYEGAIKDHDEAIKLKPKLDESYNLKGLIKSYLGKNEEAIKDYDEAIRLNSESGNYYCNRGISKGSLGRYEEAIKDYDEAIRLNSKSGDYYYRRGISKGSLGRYEEAIKDYDKAINLNPKLAKAYNNKGTTSLILGDIKLAIECYGEAIKINDKLWAPHFNLGILYKESEKLKESINELMIATELNRQSKECLFILGELLLNYLNDKEGKENTLNYLKELDKNKIKNECEAIEKFIKGKCYILINNLKRIEELNPEIQKKLSEEIKLNLLKEFENKIKYLREQEKTYNDTYFMYNTIDKRLINDLNEKRMWKGKPEYFNDPFDPYYKKFSTILKKELGRVRISCFTESNDNLLMWAHYGDNHKGVCFGYKFKEIYKNIFMDNLTFFEKVIYKGMSTHIEKNGMIKLPINSNKELLTISEVYLRKHKDWEYENEWRLINLDYKKDYYKNIEISEVYFGLDCNLEDIRLIIKILKDRDGIIFYKMFQGNNLTLNSCEIELNKNKEVILDNNGEIKIKSRR